MNEVIVVNKFQVAKRNNQPTQHEQNKPATGLPFSWCGCHPNAMGNCDTCQGRSASDPAPHTWEN